MSLLWSESKGTAWPSLHVLGSLSWKQETEWEQVTVGSPRVFLEMKPCPQQCHAGHKEGVGGSAQELG